MCTVSTETAVYNHNKQKAILALLVLQARQWVRVQDRKLPDHRMIKALQRLLMLADEDWMRKECGFPAECARLAPS